VKNPTLPVARSVGDTRRPSSSPPYARHYWPERHASGHVAELMASQVPAETRPTTAYISPSFPLLLPPRAAARLPKTLAPPHSLFQSTKQWPNANPGDGAASNGFGRRSLHDWEARLLYKANYPAPLDFRGPPSWRSTSLHCRWPPIWTTKSRPPSL
jgi:hypothetical protein